MTRVLGRFYGRETLCALALVHESNFAQRVRLNSAYFCNKAITRQIVFAVALFVPIFDVRRVMRMVANEF